HPPNVFVLPKTISTDARIFDLPNPASSESSRFLFCPQGGFYEFTKITVPARECRSWLVAPSDPGLHQDNDQAPADIAHAATASEDGYVLQQPHMFVATPFDPIFIILPCLLPRDIDATTADTDLQKRIDDSSHYQSLSDHLDNLFEIVPSLKQATHTRGALESHLQPALNRICNAVEAGDENMYRLSIRRLYAELIRKAEQVTKRGLPVSLEERFVKQRLAAPELNERREESSVSIMEDGQDKKGNDEQSQDSGYGSQTRESTEAANNEITSNNSLEPSGGIQQLLRLRTALDFIARSYLSTPLQLHIQQFFAKRPDVDSAMSQKDRETISSYLIDFSPLETHFGQLDARKRQAQALRCLSDNISRKRGAADDEEAMEKAETKRKKKDEDEARKKNVSRGVKQLEKVNRSGMKTLSNFFTKAVQK
ncbi:hypothetical protein K431DRAFT_207294, partial [Polychaeton citri CBS 116435]